MDDLELSEPVETMQTTLRDGSEVKRIVLDMDGAGMNVVVVTGYKGGEHDGRMQVSICSDAEHQNGDLIQHFLTQEQTASLRKWFQE